MVIMEFLILTLIGVGGIVLNILADFRDLVSKESKNGKTFKERLNAVWGKFDLLRALAYATFAIIVVMIVVGLRNRLADIYPVTELTILFTGFATDAAFKKLKPETLKDD